MLFTTGELVAAKHLVSIKALDFNTWVNVFGNGPRTDFLFNLFTEDLNTYAKNETKAKEENARSAAY